jgi:hypothetical protein
VIGCYAHLEKIPALANDWEVPVRGAAKLAATLAGQRDDALLFRRLATLVRDGPPVGAVDDWRWRGPTPGFAAIAERIGVTPLAQRLARIASQRS